MNRVILISLLLSACTTTPSILNNDNPLKIIKSGTIFTQAEIINFDPNKCACCWGWLIKVENDTIKSPDNKIAKVVGFEIRSPVLVDIEIGILDLNCSKRKYGYYSINSIRLSD